MEFVYLFFGLFDNVHLTFRANVINAYIVAISDFLCIVITTC